VKKIERLVLSFLPESLKNITLRAIKNASGTLSEIHLRADAFSSLALRTNGVTRNIALPIALSQGEIREILSCVCDGSVYAFEESIREGFVTLKGGVRVGVGGRASTRGGVTSLSGVESLCFRIPHAVRGCADALVSFFKEKRCGILLFAPPSGGKTTLLRELARELSQGKDALRCAVIDSRGELLGFEKECLVDRLSGYPKGKGAEIAVRTLSPELLIMDELGKEDRDALLSLSSLGVPVIASVHGKTAGEVLSGALRPLFSEGIFPYLWDVKKGMPTEARKELV